jgi:hypothetical protein
LTFVLIFVIVYIQKEREKKRLRKGKQRRKKVKKFEKFFSYDENEGKIVLHPVNMGSDSWVLRSADDYFLEFSLEQFLEHGAVLLEDGNHLLQLVELDDYVCFCIEFVVKGRKVIIEEVSCRSSYKKNYFSVMPDKGIYTL